MANVDKWHRDRNEKQKKKFKERSTNVTGRKKKQNLREKRS